MRDKRSSKRRREPASLDEFSGISGADTFTVVST
jgi:hypothetical protein